MTIQTPVRYKVTDTPVRIGGMEPPYTILNMENSGTVWISHNPGMLDSQAAPLKPGATLTWNNPGDFFAKCSAGESCEILLTRDITDWTGFGGGAEAQAIADAIEAIPLSNVGIGQQVNLALGLGTFLNWEDVVTAALRENDEVLLVNNAAIPTSGTLVDISNYQSLHVHAYFLAANRNLSLEFRRTGSTFIQRRLNIKSGFRIDANGGSTWRATIPVRGQALFLDANTSTDTIVTLIGSQKPTDKINQDVMDADAVIIASENANYLFSERNNTLPTANTAQYDLHPWFGSITADINYTSTVAPGAVAWCQWVRNQNNVATTIRRDAITADPPANSYGCTSTIACTGDALRFEIVNNSGVSFTAFNTTITPTGGFGL